MTLDVDLHIQKGRMQDVNLKVRYLKLHTSCRTFIYTRQNKHGSEFLRSLSLLNVNIKFYSLCNLEVMSLSL